MEALGNTIDHDRDYVVQVRGENTDQSGEKSDSSSDSLESAADSDPKSATGDCLIYSHTKEVAINSTCKKVLEESPFQLGLWTEATLSDTAWGPAEMDWW